MTARASKPNDVGVEIEAGPRLRHRPSRHDARLPAAFRPPAEAPPTGRRARRRLRRRRAGDRRRQGPQAQGLARRHRSGRGRGRQRQCAAQRRRRALPRRSSRAASRAVRCREGAPYDVVFANILAKPLRLLAPSLAAVIARDGDAIVSGLLLRRRSRRAGRLARRRGSTCASASTSRAGRACGWGGEARPAVAGLPSPPAVDIHVPCQGISHAAQYPRRRCGRARRQAAGDHGRADEDGGGPARPSARDRPQPEGDAAARALGPGQGACPVDRTRDDPAFDMKAFTDEHVGRRLMFIDASAVVAILERGARGRSLGHLHRELPANRSCFRRSSASRRPSPWRKPERDGGRPNAEIARSKPPPRLISSSRRSGPRRVGGNPRDRSPRRRRERSIRQGRRALPRRSISAIASPMRARAFQQMLLFIGGDFSKTDIQSALSPST